MKQIEQTINSIEVAEMVSKKHSELLGSLTVEYQKKYSQVA